MSKGVEFNVDNTVKKAKNVYTGINGVKRRITKILTSVNNVVKVIYEYNGGQVTEGYIVTADSSSAIRSQVYFTNNFVDYVYLAGFSSPIQTIFCVNNHIYIYTASGTGITAWRCYIASVEDVQKVINGELSSLPLTNNRFSILNTGLSNPYFNNSYDGVMFHNNKFYTFCYTQTAQSSGYRYSNYLLVSENGYEWTYYATSLSFSNSSKKYEMGSFAFNFLFNENKEYIVFSAGYVYSTSSWNILNHYIALSNLGTSTFISSTTSSTLKITTMIRYNGELYCDGSGTTGFQKFKLDSNDVPVVEGIGSYKNNNALSLIGIVNEKIYAIDSAGSKIYYLSSSAIPLLIGEVGIAYMSFFTTPDNDLLLFDNFKKLYLLDTDSNTITDYGSSPYKLYSGVTDNRKFYFYMS